MRPVQPAWGAEELFKIAEEAVGYANTDYPEAALGRLNFLKVRLAAPKVSLDSLA
jgi:hypothetical protein